MAENTGKALKEWLKDMPDVQDHMRRLAVLADANEAEKLARDYVESSFRMAYGQEVERLDAAIIEQTAKTKEGRKAVESQQQLVNKTSRMIRVQEQRRKEIPDEKARDLRKWRDWLLVALCFIIAFLVLGMSAVNVFSIIEASRIPLFLERPELAWMLSGLLPIGAFALEFLKRHFTTDRAKYRYTMLVYSLTASLLLIWIVLFALVYGNPASGMDVDALMGQSSGNPLDMILTMTQLLAELFVGASLFMAGGDLLDRHSPTRLIANPDYEEAAALLKAMRQEHETCTALLNDLKGSGTSLQAASRLWMQEQMLLFKRLRAQLCD